MHVILASATGTSSLTCDRTLAIVALAASCERPSLRSPQVVAERSGTTFLKQRAELHVGAAVGGKILSIRQTQSADQGIAMLPVNLAVLIAMTAIKVRRLIARFQDHLLSGYSCG